MPINAVLQVAVWRKGRDGKIFIHFLSPDIPFNITQQLVKNEVTLKIAS